MSNNEMNNAKQIEEIFEDLIDAPVGGVKEDFTIVTMKDKYTDAFIRTIASHLASKNYRKQSEGELTKAHIEAHYEAICALADMVNQFGYSTTFRKQKAVCDGGLSALEYAFGALQDCGCKINSNGSITLKNLWAFQEEFEAKMKGGE